MRIGSGHARLGHSDDAIPSEALPISMIVSTVHSALLYVILLFGVVPPAWAAEPPAPAIGVMLGGGGLNLSQRIAVTRELGVALVRPWDISLEEWNGHHGDTDAFTQAGFRIVMTVRHNGRGGAPPRPTSPPTDLTLFKRKLGEALDLYRPELLVVENEENSVLHYLGTPKQYGTELKAACEVAHTKGIKCANGGLASSLVATLVWSHYRDGREAAKAAEFLRRTTSTPQQKMLRTVDGQQRIGEAIAKGKALLAEYKAAGLDYINFHWYVADPSALAETVEFLKAETGLQPMTNEMGQSMTDAAAVTSLLGKAMELGLPYVIWSSVDRPDAKALQNPDGTLRESGLAFQQLIRNATGQAPTERGLSRQ